MKVQVKDVLKKFKVDAKKFKLDDKTYDKTMQQIKNYVETNTTKYVLKTIKPIIDKKGVIELEFMGLELWPSGHFVGVFDDEQKEFTWIVSKMGDMLKQMFPTGDIMRQHDMIPHITLGKYDTDDMNLFDKLKQPTKVQPYRLIKKQWIIYPSVRFRRD